MVEAPGKRPADSHDGPVDRQHLLDLGLSEGERNRNHRVNPFAQQEVVQDALAARGPSVMLYRVRS